MFKTEHISDCVYSNYPIESIDHVNEVVADPEIIGLNVTIPYKQQIIQYLDKIDAEAETIGAVNTIKVHRKSGKIILEGFNTDIYGFEKPLVEHLGPKHRSALILGTGGASKAVAYILNKHNIKFRYVSRSPKTPAILSYDLLTKDILQEHKIIVNSSPVGTYPDIDKCPDIDYDAIGIGHILYDLVYNPEKTLFLQKGESKGAIIINGLPMLHGQAEKAWEIWNRKD